MSLTEHLINPDPVANPHALGKQQVPIAPISNWPIGSVSSVLVFPSALDEERLRNAIAKAASFWPTVAGRYVKASNGEFAISLTQSPIPFSTQTTADEYPFPDKHVVQPSLGSYLPPLRDDYPAAGSDAPLVAFRLSTLATGSSVLGVNWGHVLGDAASFSRFLEDVSLFYNMSFADLGEDMPTFEPHVTIPKATEQVLKDFHLDILAPIPVDQVIKGYTDTTIASKPMTVTLSRNDIAHITVTRSQGEHFTDSDMVSGWWISVLERAGIQVNKVVQTINYRDFHKENRAFPPNLPTLAANVAQMREIPLPPPRAGQKAALRARDIARAIRSGMNALKNNPDEMLSWLSNAAHEVGTAAREGKGHCLVPKPGGVVINSNIRYDWAIKFGQAGANYHTDVSLLRFLRVFLANAKPGTEGGPVDERDIELIFRVPVGPAAKSVAKIIEDDREKWKGEPLPEEEEATEPEVRTFRMNNTVAQAPWGGD